MFRKVITVELEVTNAPSFFPLLMEVARIRFGDVNILKDRYIRTLRLIESELLEFQKPSHLATAQSISRVQNYFAQIGKSLDYFNIVLVGNVNAGKSSLILDLLKTSAEVLNEIIKKGKDYEKNYDDFFIGPNVCQHPIYEILDKKFCLRLVDIPGISSVIFSKFNFLDSFFDMADCIAFLIDANNDISNEEYNFLKENIPAEKQVIIILNKWNSAYGKLPPKKAEEFFEKKKDWILFGKENSEFKGIAKPFSEIPMVVKATTSQRDDDTGEPYFPAEIEEVVEGLKNMLIRGGISRRTTEPIRFLEKELARLKNHLRTNFDLSALQTLEKLEGLI
jgi:GTPase SAR1 family protein